MSIQNTDELGNFSIATTAYDANGDLYYILANAFLTVWISTKGQITSITDTALG